LRLKSKDDATKFEFTFETRLQYTRSIEAEVKVWVAKNIVRWNKEQPDWFKIEFIPDEFLPITVLEAEGGAAKRKRRRSSVSLREIVGLEEKKTADIRVHPQSVEMITA